MTVVYCGIVPHPPIMVPEVGRGEAKKVKKTQDALLELGRRIKDSGAETMVIITPHGAVFGDAVGINTMDVLEGDLGRFNAPEVRIKLPCDRALVKAIRRQAEARGIRVGSIDRQLEESYPGRVSARLDHGIMAPLYWLRKAGWEGAMVAVSMAFLANDQLYSFGIAVREAVEQIGKKVAVVASGDLSHRLTEDAPAGYDPAGEVFDREVVRLIGEGDVLGLMQMEANFLEKAGECGYRPVLMMFGVLDGYQFEPEVLSYEGPFGVGYMVAAVKPGAPDDSRRLLEKLRQQRRAETERRRANESYLVRIARQQLENYVLGRKEEPDLGEVPPEFQKPHGVFVSIKKHGRLRGCIGTIAPTRENTVEEVLANAIAAGTRDPRFDPVQPGELDELEYSVDVLSEPEPIRSVDDLDPKKYGVIVQRGHRSGVLLPDLEGIDTVAEQLAIAKQKAGIPPEEPCEILRFTVTRYR
ncbi:MAG: AmmeMemoRadiSam system protein A [Peptococcaceae bacterium]|nr:AmmeMemoRadiSam system protein A [Peptococcaceae bacterium]